MIYSNEQNTFIVSYFRTGRFINDESIYSLSVFKNKLQTKYPGNIHNDSLLTHIGQIVSRFLTTRTSINQSG
jgi:hypothetical protein